MDVLIKETSETKTLSLIDRKTGQDCAADFVGNTDALVDGTIVWDDELESLVCDQATFDWWDKVLDDTQALDNRIALLAEDHGWDAVDVVVRDACWGDLEDHAPRANKALDEAFGPAEE